MLVSPQVRFHHHLAELLRVVFGFTLVLPAPLPGCRSTDRLPQVGRT